MAIVGVSGKTSYIGAQILSLQKSGSLQPGMLADIAIYRLDDPRYFAVMRTYFERIAREFT